MDLIRFDPATSESNILPDAEGIYFVVSESNAALPKEMRELNYKSLYGMPILYIGISKELRRRDYHNHFNGTARNSTLRKSIGSLFNLRKFQLPSEAGTNKYKFISEDEKILSLWMKENLIMYYFLTDNSEVLENELIQKFHPPLNINKNKGGINKDFKKFMMERRKFERGNVL